MKKLKIRTHSMLSPIDTIGGASSWIYTIHSLMKVYEKQGHDLHFITTNGIKGVDRKWLKYFRDCPTPDIDFAYCTPNNYPYRFSGVLPNTTKAKIRCGIMNYESSILPQDWVQYHKDVDFMLPSSEYCRDIFIRAGIPEEKVVVMPLGIDMEALDAPIDDAFQFQTKKKFKLLNVSIPHYRKNIGLLVDAYYEEFSDSDDICLVLKTSIKQGKDRKEAFEVDVIGEINNVARRFNKQLPEIEIVQQRFENIATLYKKTDALICVSGAEGWFLPGLEAMYCGKVVAAPRYSGQLDFLEHNINSLLIDTVEVKAPSQYQYWAPDPNAVIGLPVKESMMATMRKLYEQNDALKEKFEKKMKEAVKIYSWENSARIMMDLYEGKSMKRKIGEIV